MPDDNKKQIIRLGLDLDGVLAEHPLGGVFFYVRQIKEKILKKVEKRYYYPDTFLEQKAWIVINSIRRPNKRGIGLLRKLVEEERVEVYCITSRFKFLENLTQRWLKFYRLYDSVKLFVNKDDLYPNEFKAKVINDLGIEVFVDDDFEAISFLRKKTKAKLFWLSKSPFSPKDGFKKVSSLAEALETLNKKSF